MRTRVHEVVWPALLTLVLLADARDAHAYLDLGTGSMVFQVLVAGFVAASFTVKMYWRRLKALFSGRSLHAGARPGEDTTREGDAAR